MRQLRAVMCALVVTAVAAPCAFAGVLTPPGAPTPTMKTLTQVEPRVPIGPLTTPGDADSLYRITQPGSYYLTGDVVGRAAFYGIQIESDDVSLDLMGFALRGVAGSRSGVIVSGGVRTGLEVRNGVIRDWGDYGMFLTSADGAVLRDLRLISNGFSGVLLRSGRVEGCTARENGAGGFLSSTATAFLNCSAEDNTGDGFDAGIAASLVNCAALLNSGIGIQVGSAGSVLACSSQQNGGDGFDLGFGSSLTGSAARANAGRGVNGGQGAVIINNTFDRNGLDGVRVTARSLVKDNTCSLNGDGAGAGAGVLVTETDNRIEGNNLVGNDIGLDVDSFGNFIVRNTASGNATNWDIAASNKVGVIVSAPNSGAIVGFTGGAGVGSTDPWANFSY